jgi:hypothetical protein
MKRVTTQLEGYPLHYEVEGEVSYGSDRVLFEEDPDLLAHAEWRRDGFVVSPFLESLQYQVLLGGFKDLFLSALPVPLSFELQDYHRHLENGVDHSAVIRRIRGGFSLRDFPGDLQAVEARISEICGTDLTAWHSAEPMQIFFIRIVRPNRIADYNPPHRDVWLDRLRNAVNIYLPIAGSNSLSSLPLIPGSHGWRESEVERTCHGAVVGGVRFQVPAVTGCKKPLRMVRPNPLHNEVLVFSPYLIHGGGVNLNDDQTRMSLEMRFWKRG